jgi:hypothetical protein
MFLNQKAGRDHNIPHYQKATFEVVKCLMEAMVLTKIPWSIIFDDKFSTVDEAWRLAIEAQDRHRGLAGAPVCTASGCQLGGGPSLQINSQIRVAVSWFILLDWSHDDTKSKN